MAGGGMMGALYEDVENFFGDIFAWYGRVVARYPVAFVLVPMVTCGLLGLGLLTLEYETDVETLYAPLDSAALADQRTLRDLYPDQSASNFYQHQQVSNPLFAEIMVRAPDPGPLDVTGDMDNRSSTNVLTTPRHKHILDLYDVIRYNVSFVLKGRVYTYGDVCAIRGGACIVDGEEPLRDSCISPNDSARHAPFLSGLSFEGPCVAARTLKLRFNLRNNDSSYHHLSIEWEKQFLKTMKNYELVDLELRYVASESLDLESHEHVVQDAKFLVFAILAMLIFAVFIGSGGNCVTNHVTLAFAGVCAALMAILGAFGLLSFMGIKFVNLCGVMPFLILGETSYAPL